MHSVVVRRCDKHVAHNFKGLKLFLSSHFSPSRNFLLDDYTFVHCASTSQTAAFLSSSHSSGIAIKRRKKGKSTPSRTIIATRRATDRATCGHERLRACVHVSTIRTSRLVVLLNNENPVSARDAATIARLWRHGVKLLLYSTVWRLGEPSARVCDVRATRSKSAREKG